MPTRLMELERRGIMPSPTPNHLFVPAYAIPLARAINRVHATEDDTQDNGFDRLLFRVVWNEAQEIAEPHRFIAQQERILRLLVEAAEVKPIGFSMLDQWRGRACRLIPRNLAVAWFLLALSPEQREQSRISIDAPSPRDNRLALVEAFGQPVAQVPAADLSLITIAEKCAAALRVVVQANPPRKKLMDWILTTRTTALRAVDLLSDVSPGLLRLLNAPRRLLTLFHTWEDERGKRHRISDADRRAFRFAVDSMMAASILGASVLPDPAPAHMSFRDWRAQGGADLPTDVPCLMGGRSHLLRAVLERTAIVEDENGDRRVVSLAVVGLPQRPQKVLNAR